MTTKSFFTFLILNGDNDPATITKVLNEIPHIANSSVEKTESLSSAIKRIAQRGINAFILTHHIFDMDLARDLQKILMTDTSLVVVVVTGRVQKGALNLAKQLTRIGVIEKPLQDGELRSVCEKVMKGQRVHVREHKRWATKQKTIIESVETQKRAEGFIFNISKGGVYVETEYPDLNSGEVVKVTIPLDEIGKSHVVFARIVWVVRQGYGRGHPGYGLQFMDVEDVTNLLLERL